MTSFSLIHAELLRDALVLVGRARTSGGVVIHYYFRLAEERQGHHLCKRRQHPPTHGIYEVRGWSRRILGDRHSA